jgi:hypothetical protein
MNEGHEQVALQPALIQGIWVAVAGSDKHLVPGDKQGASGISVCRRRMTSSRGLGNVLPSFISGSAVQEWLAVVNPQCAARCISPASGVGDIEAYHNNTWILSPV